jgi:hypothetical protein
LAWVMGIREVRHVTVVDEPIGRCKGPLRTKVERIICDLPSRSIAQVIGYHTVIFLPMHEGAGPCGTLARVKPLAGKNSSQRRSPLAINSIKGSISSRHG